MHRSPVVPEVSLVLVALTGPVDSVVPVDVPVGSGPVVSVAVPVPVIPLLDVGTWSVVEEVPVSVAPTVVGSSVVEPCVASVELPSGVPVESPQPANAGATTEIP